MYIVRDFYSDEPEPPVRGGMKAYKEVIDAFEAGKELARTYMFGRDSDIEGPFRFFTLDRTALKNAGWCMVFESRDYYVWVERIDSA